MVLESLPLPSSASLNALRMWRKPLWCFHSSLCFLQKCWLSRRSSPESLLEWLTNNWARTQLFSWTAALLSQTQKLGIFWPVVGKPGKDSKRLDSLSSIVFTCYLKITLQWKWSLVEWDTSQPKYSTSLTGLLVFQQALQITWTLVSGLELHQRTSSISIPMSDKTVWKLYSPAMIRT